MQARNEGASATSGPDGSFLLAPLGAGAYPFGGRGGRVEEILVETLASGLDVAQFFPPERREELARNATTDARGRFRLAGLATGDYRVFAAHLDHPGAAGRVSIERPGELVLAFSFAGRARGAPTDGRGEYSIRGLMPGAYFVSLGADFGAPEGGDGGGSAARGFAAKTANVEAGRTTRVDFGAEPQAIVAGRVTRGGAPVASAFLQFFPESGAVGFRGATTDAEGRYEVALAPGRYLLRVENFSEPLEVSEGLARIERDVRLPEGAIAGRVLNAATGEPVRARVQIYKAERPGAADSLAAVLGALAGDTGTDPEQGAFYARGLAPGTYTVIARADGFAQARVDGVEVPPDGAAEGIELALEPGGVFFGRVLDEAGEPVAGAAIWVVDVDAKDIPSGDPPRTGAGGEFEIRRFAPGRYRVTVLSE